MNPPWRALAPAIFLLACTGADPDVLDTPDQARAKPAAADSAPLQVATGAPAGEVDPDAPKKKVEQPPVAPEEAPPASTRLADLPKAEELLQKTKTYFEGHVGRRIHLMVDKPLYRPGETIWIKSWDLRARDFTGELAHAGLRYELVSPKGAVVVEKQVRQAGGVATNDFEIPAGVPGGEYKVRAIAFDGVKGERPVIVSAYEAPRIKKKLEFVRKAYGAGDEVTATVEVKRATGEPLQSHPLRAQIVLDGELLPEVKTSTNADGGGLVRFRLPDQIERGDGLLTVLVDDGGVVESVSKRVPIVLKKVELSFFPEGGRMIEGLPGRVYFEAKNTIGKPADLEGRIVDDQGNAVAKFSSYHQGLGRFEFTPATGRKYHAEVTRPVGITEKYALPLAEEKGCVLRSYDDLDGQETALRVAVRCTEKQNVVVTAVLRENVLDTAAVAAGPDAPAVVWLTPKDEALARARGVARVTVFDADLAPVAERIVFRNRRNGLRVKLEPDQQSYVPREQVALKVTTTGEDGAPVQAELALSVVDDTVISFADDKEGHLLSRLLLEPEVPGKVEEPNFYFDLKEEKSAAALDLLMGARGWRKFEWAPVMNPPPPLATATGLGGIGLRGAGAGGGGFGRGRGIGMAKGAGFGRGDRRVIALDEIAVEGAFDGAEVELAAAEPKAAAAPMAMRPAPPPVMPQPAAAPMAEPDPVPADAPAEIAEPEPPMAQFAAAGAAMPMREEAMERQAAKMDLDDDWEAAKDEEKPMMNRAAGRARIARGPRQPIGWAPVRVFPAPTYDGAFEGPRTDFRDTVYWNPAVKTGVDGQATVTFYLSDAVTSFRVFAEGAGDGRIGRSEEVFDAKLPFSMSVKLPLEVSEGDRLYLPLILANERDQALPVSLAASFGDLLTLEKPVALPAPQLAANARESLYYPVRVTGQRGQSKVMFSADAGGLKDELVREVRVEPLGFPQLQELGGTLVDRVAHTFDLGDATPGTAEVTLKLYPSPVSSMTSGLDALIRQPSGCFEQTSSSNYPNVMVLQYLQANDVADPALVARTTKLLDQGYGRLVGYETKDKGYEWFGSSPPHEALTAYGVLQFKDMQQVYGSVDTAMIERTVAWLKARRDGKGGYLRDGKALDSFGRASPEVTNAYITYAVSEAGLAGQFEAEIAAQAKLAAETNDAYLLALGANTLLNVPAREGEARAALKRLAEMQDKSGAWTRADHSITRSGGVNLHIETTGLALLALMKAGGHEDAVRGGVEWLQKNRGGFGNFGSTQATVLALKALTDYTTRSRQTQSDGSVQLLVNGAVVASQDYRAGRRDPIEFSGLGKHFTQGKNEVEIRHQGQSRLPLSMAVEYRAVKPATHPEVAVEVATALARSEVKMGENVRLTATVKNRTQQGQPMTLARVGLPGGLTFQNWQLKELREKGIISFFETRPREVILYFRDLAPGAAKEIPLDLVAMVPGEFTGPSSSAYLYYTDDKKFWADGLKVRVTR